MFVPFFFHWYEGVVPPLAGVAVKVTAVPEQILFPGLAEIVTLAGKTAPTLITIADEVAGLLVTHASEEVITQVIASLFISVEEA